MSGTKISFETPPLREVQKYFEEEKGTREFDNPPERDEDHKLQHRREGEMQINIFHHLHSLFALANSHHLCWTKVGG